MKPIAFLVAFGLAGQCAAAEIVVIQDRELNNIKKDMTADDVRNRLGKPDRVARQILFRRHLEQWIYDDWSARIEFNCHPGEEPRVISVILTGPNVRP